MMFTVFYIVFFSFLFPEPLEVTEEPSMSGLDLRQGDSLHLSCSATGFPYPHYQWFRGKEKLLGQEGNELLITNIR